MVGDDDDAGLEFSRIVSLGDVGEDGLRLELRATGDECAALARRFGLAAIAALSASGRLTRAGGGGMRLVVSLNAELTQTCVVTLEPLTSRIEEDVDILFEPDLADPASPDVGFDPTADREPLMGDSLDVGEIIAEELALSLDPYPRKPGVAVEIGPGGPDARGEGAPRDRPFEALAALKRKD